LTARPGKWRGAAVFEQAAHNRPVGKELKEEGGKHGELKGHNKRGKTKHG